MGSVLVVVADIVQELTFQMGLVEGNDVVEQIAAGTFDLPLGYSVLPGTLKRRSHRRQTHRAYGDRDFRTIFSVAVED